MKANLGNTDRIVRTVIGVGMVGIGMRRRSWMAVLGLYPLITGLMGSDPIYSAMGISTKKTLEDEMLESFEEPVEVAVP